MTGIGYIRMEEVPGIPRLSRTPGAVVYTPLGETPVDPDVVLFVTRHGSRERIPGPIVLLFRALLPARARLTVIVSVFFTPGQALPGIMPGAGIVTA